MNTNIQGHTVVNNTHLFKDLNKFHEKINTFINYNMLVLVRDLKNFTSIISKYFENKGYKVKVISFIDLAEITIENENSFSTIVIYSNFKDLNDLDAFKPKFQYIIADFNHNFNGYRNEDIVNLLGTTHIEKHHIFVNYFDQEYINKTYEIANNVKLKYHEMMALYNS